MTSAATDRTHRTSHETTVQAPARAVYDLVADVGRWPYVFEPTVYVSSTALGPGEERLRLWAFANGEVRNWESERTLDPDAMRVRFHQVVSSPPVEYMGGEWILESVSPTTTKVTLLHDFRTVDDNEEHTEWILAATDRNSNAELAALKRTAELGDEFDELVVSFDDTVRINAPRALAYDFVYRVDLWPERLPHVGRLELTEKTPGVQFMEMDTVGGEDNSVHTTHSVRVCFDGESIVYKQTSRPPIMAAHTGCWTFSDVDGGVDVTSYHTVVIDPESISKVLGPEGTPQVAAKLLKEALSTNSLTTLNAAKAHAEGATT
jgi:aromatase